MNTPICDFLKKYAASSPLRLHMPGHKGNGVLGIEALDVTEVAGADSLYDASGIIRESEENASRLFGCPTYYSTEGSSQCIRAMLRLALLHAAQTGRAPRILAARNAHKTFLSALSLLGAEVDWLYPEREDSYLSCTPSPTQLLAYLKNASPLPAALYITSPDYLGTLSDVESLAAVCHRYGVLLLVDNAHGAYLRYLPESHHPMDLGADMVCDSAHKTLPVLTGGAYLHLSPRLPAALLAQVKDALALFGSTSPSYLILASLDAANPRMETELPREIAEFLPRVMQLWLKLQRMGWKLCSDEPLKMTLCPKSYGYTGDALAEHLRTYSIECEFADPDYVVLMLSPLLPPDALERVEAALAALPRREAITLAPPALPRPERVLSPREALLSPAEHIDAEASLGKIPAAATVACPPAVPLIVSGERIDKDTLAAFCYYGIKTVSVVKE